MSLAPRLQVLSNINCLRTFMALQNTFRLQSRHIFLTFPRLSLDNDNGRTILLDHLTSVAESTDNSIRHYVIARERHDDFDEDDTDEPYHFHCLLELTEKLSTRDQFHFDLFTGYGPINGFHHCNIQTPKGSVPKWVNAKINYCRKEDAAPLSNYPHQTIETQPNILDDYLNTDLSDEQAMRSVLRISPNLLTSYYSLVAQRRSMLQRPNVLPASFNLADFTEPPELVDWRRAHLEVLFLLQLHWAGSPPGQASPDSRREGSSRTN